jgi:hypothetical protein
VSVKYIYALVWTLHVLGSTSARSCASASKDASSP